MNLPATPREELYCRLPSAVQPLVTWMSGIPGASERSRIPMTPMLVILVGITSILFGFMLIKAAFSQNNTVFLGLYFFGVCFVAGGMRRLDVLVIHQSLHSKVLSTPKKNRILGEILTTILLRTPYEENRKEHLGHHRAPCDENDGDVIFLRNAGVAMANSKWALYLKILMISLSPIFHIRFTINRLVSNFIKAKPAYRLAMSWGYATILLSPTIIVGSNYLVSLAFFWLVPLTVGFQISNFLYTATKHRWWMFSNKTVKDREKRDMLSYARICCSAAPKNPSTIGWSIWWLEAFFVHVPVRLFVVVGDTVQHDLHHVAPTCDWPNSAYERVIISERTPERFTEVWGGIFAHLKECNLEGSSYDTSNKTICA